MLRLSKHVQNLEKIDFQHYRKSLESVIKFFQQCQFKILFVVWCYRQLRAHYYNYYFLESAKRGRYAAKKCTKNWKHLVGLCHFKTYTKRETFVVIFGRILLGGRTSKGPRPRRPDSHHVQYKHYYSVCTPTLSIGRRHFEYYTWCFEWWKNILISVLQANLREIF